MCALIRLENRGGGPDSAKFPVNFPVSREFGAETGSQLTASSAGQSVSNAYGIGSHVFGHRLGVPRTDAPLLAPRSVEFSQKTPLKYFGEVEVCVQHLGILVGSDARARVWPQIISWLKSEGLNWVKNEQSGHA